MNKKTSADDLLSTRTIRNRCQKIFDLTKEGKTHFRLDLSRLEPTAEKVLSVIQRQYPDLRIPHHSRWGHFRVGGVDRLAPLEETWKKQNLSPLEVAKAKIDLAIVSVLLDAGAGTQWQFHEKETGKSWSRSEGLAVASLHLFREGLFSSQPADHPLQVDAEGLRNNDEKKWSAAMQVRPDNPLVGEAGRYQLLRNLGQTLLASPQYFGEKNPRPGNLLDHFSSAGPLPAGHLLTFLLRALGPIWPGRLQWEGVPLGDVWDYPPLKDPQGQDPGAHLVPFHKLSQWLTYSLIEPIEEAGISVEGLEELTGLPEYRNGGLFLDHQVITLADPRDAEKEHAPSDPLIIEWRALTVILLDHLAVLLRGKLGKSQEQFPLTKILEGGTWQAGREIAAQLRQGGGPPLTIKSDGTVF